MRGWLVRAGLLGAVVLLGVLAFVVVALTRATPAVTLVPAHLPKAFPGRLAPAWPRVGQAAMAVPGVGLLLSPGLEHPAPIASVAKVMTAYIVLRDHPIPAGAVGPSIIVRPADLALYRSDRSLGESVAKVTVGERLTERQALEALLLPSANNIAALLAVWDAGSQEAFVDKMNRQARALGLTATHYLDTSGYDPGTTSTARDQVRLATRAMALPAFAQVVAMPRAALPVAGVKENLDGLLGRSGVVGVKTGSMMAAGACFVFASRRVVAGRRVLVVGAVLGQPLARSSSRLDAAFDATTALLDGVPRAVSALPLLARQRPFAMLRAPWADGPVAVRPQSRRLLLGWSGARVRVRILARRHPRAPIRAGQDLGRAVVREGKRRVRLRLVAARALPAPPVAWRLAHP